MDGRPYSQGALVWGRPAGADQEIVSSSSLGTSPGRDGIDIKAFGAAERAAKTFGFTTDNVVAAATRQIQKPAKAA
ncbi:MAG: hypothetical protein HOO98_02380 [Nitrospira sp.]|nr:hypothetical protein [Nitrospira sp.]